MLKIEDTRYLSYQDCGLDCGSYCISDVSNPMLHMPSDDVIGLSCRIAYDIGKRTDQTVIGFIAAPDELHFVYWPAKKSAVLEEMGIPQEAAHKEGGVYVFTHRGEPERQDISDLGKTAKELGAAATFLIVKDSEKTPDSEEVWRIEVPISPEKIAVR